MPKGRGFTATLGNPRLEEIIGLSAADSLGRGWEAAIHPEDRAETVRNWNLLVASGHVEPRESRLKLPNGEIRRIRNLVNPVKDRNGRVTGYVGTVEDITFLAQTREETVKMQRLESVGLLAGGIAHDFNNILTGILGNLSLAQMYVEESSKAHGALAQMEKAGERAVALTRQLLTFSRGGDPVKKAVSVRYLVGESVSMALRGSNVQGMICIPDGIRAVEVDKGQMLQALSNVAINAAQAMPEGGKLSVAAENMRLGSHNPLGLAGGQYVRITFADEGCGIPEADLGRIFDPYFSTKAQSTGLGLSSTYAIIVKHGGHVGVSSQPGQGTAVTVHLPSCGKLPPEDAAAVTATPPGQHRDGAILVMDDELLIRTIATQMLECLGCRVTSCENGSEAIALYQGALDAGTPFNAVIMDLTVAGGRGGEEAARGILAIDPQARLVVPSGYYHDRVMKDYRDYGFCSVMPKPYKTSELSAMLSKLFQE